jgi:hypothetical protein
MAVPNSDSSIVGIAVRGAKVAARRTKSDEQERPVSLKILADYQGFVLQRYR